MDLGLVRAEDEDEVVSFFFSLGSNTTMGSSWKAFFSSASGPYRMMSLAFASEAFKVAYMRQTRQFDEKCERMNACMHIYIYIYT